MLVEQKAWPAGSSFCQHARESLSENEANTQENRKGKSQIPGMEHHLTT